MMDDIEITPEMIEAGALAFQNIISNMRAAKKRSSVFTAKWCQSIRGTQFVRAAAKIFPRVKSDK